MHSRNPDIDTYKPEKEIRDPEPYKNRYRSNVNRIHQHGDKTVRPKRPLDPERILDRLKMSVLIVILVDRLNVDTGYLHALFVRCNENIKLILVLIAGNILKPLAKPYGESS